MKNNEICGELLKEANFAATNLPLWLQKNTMTGCIQTFDEEFNFSPLL